MSLQERIEQLVQKHGSLRAVARVTEIDVGYLSRLRAGEKVNPLKDKLRRLGLRRVVSYELIAPAAPPATPATPAAQPVPAGWRDVIQRARDGICAGGLAENAQHERSVVEPHLDGIYDALEELERDAATPAAQTADDLDDDALTVAYMAGRYDGRKAAAQPAEEVVQRLMGLAMDLAHVYSFVGDNTMPRAKTALESALRAALAQAVPAGFRLVPVEPTEEMLAAAHEGDRQYTLRNFGDVMTVQQGPWDHWVAMIAAAPSAAQEKPE